jgi:hypothetical protein
MIMKSPLTCPSSEARAGVDLFGVLNKQGQIDYLDQPIRVDQTFIDEGRAVEQATGRALEERFRFAGACLKGHCAQWDTTHSHCGLVGKIVETLGRKTEALLTPCAIRMQCRWHAQSGADACANCNELVRNVEEKRLADVTI